MINDGGILTIKCVSSLLNRMARVTVANCARPLEDRESGSRFFMLFFWPTVIRDVLSEHLSQWFWFERLLLGTRVWGAWRNIISAGGIVFQRIGWEKLFFRMIIFSNVQMLWNEQIYFDFADTQIQHSCVLSARTSSTQCLRWILWNLKNHLWWISQYLMSSSSTEHKPDPSFLAFILQIYFLNDLFCRWTST